MTPDEITVLIYYVPTKTDVVVTQKDCLGETVLLSYHSI